MSFIKVLGSKTYTRLCGNLSSDVTLIFIPPATLHSDSMQPFVSHFENYRCLLLDLPAHGKSEGLNRTTVEDWGQWMKAYLEVINNKGWLSKKNIVIGYSMSAAIALEVMLLQLDFIHGAISLSGGLDIKGHNGIEKSISRCKKETFTYLDVFNISLIDTPLTTLNEKQLEIAKTMVPLAICFEDFRAAMNYTALERAKHIQAPVLLIVGEQDKTIYPISSYNTHEALKELSTLVRIPHEKHSLIYTVPKQLRQIITEWIGGTFGEA